MANDEPPYLTVGTDVSAKYKGAFCEAKIKKVNKVVKCKVTFKNNLGSFMVTHDLIKGNLRMGADVEAKHPEKNQFLEAIINKLQDYSQYTVVFDDGDETTLRRTSLCLKSGRHFAESPTLDQFPLTNPEHFGTPVIGTGKYKRKRRSTMNSSLDYESSDDDSFPKKLKAIRGKEKDPDLGKVVAVDYGDRRKKDSWYPGLIVPHPAQSTIKISKEEHLIRSFKDGKYYQVPKRDTREFIKDNIPKIENNSLKIAVDKAVSYLDNNELPPNWDKVLFMGLDLPSADEDSQDSDTDSSDDEPSEDKDRFVAQLYKFMDERGTPINKAPAVSNRDLNLYKLFKIMHKLGGFNKVTNQNKWKVVYCKMGLPQSNPNGPTQIKGAYKRYLQSFEDFYRKLGCTMVNNSRSMRGRHRSDRNLSIITRTREREASSPKGRNSKDSKDKAAVEKKTEEKPTASEKKDIKNEEIPKVEEKPKSPEKKKIEKPKQDEKDDKKKKDDRPRLVRSQSLNNKDKKETIPKEEDKKDIKPEKARTREDARKEKSETPEKKGTRSSIKLEKEKEEPMKEKKDQSPKIKEKKEEKPLKDPKEEKTKEKKDEKNPKDRKSLKDKKSDEKPKTEDPPKVEKKDEKPLREKRDSSKELKIGMEDNKGKSRKDDVSKLEEKSPVKKKIERQSKDKKEEKIAVRPRRENKSPLPDNKKAEIVDTKKIKDEKKCDVEVKKEDIVAKEKPGPKLRDRRDDILITDDEEDAADGDIDEKDTASQDGFEKKAPGPSSKDDNQEPPNKGRKKSTKPGDKEDCEDLLSDSDDDTFLSENDKDYKDLKNCEIELGDRVKVKYGRGRLKRVYDAKVLKIQSDGTEKRYFVHYNGWNNRYDEWVKRNFIVALINPSKQKNENSGAKSPFQTNKKIDKGRPPGPILSSKPARKNSTSSTNSSISGSRATRSDKKATQSSPLSGGQANKKRTRRKSGVVGLTDTSQDSDSDADLDDDDVGDADVEDNANPLNDSCFKEELFSDDEEKEKMEDVKRDDIKQLEKAISVEETGDNIKDSFFTPVRKEPVKLEATCFSPVKVSLLKNDPLLAIDVVKTENKKEATGKDAKKEETPIIKEDKVSKVEIIPIVQKPTPIKIDDKVSKITSEKTSTEFEKKTFHENVKIAVSKANITPAKIVSSVSSLLESKPARHLFSPSPKTSTPLPMNDHKNKDTLKIIVSQNSPIVPENRNTLTFAGLQGLIQTNPFDRNQNKSKDSPIKVDPPKVAPTSKIESKLDSEIKNLSSNLFRAEKIMPVFGANSGIIPPKSLEPIKPDDKLTLKSNQGMFSFLKANEEIELAKSLKSIDSSFKIIPKDVPKTKLDAKNDNIPQKLMSAESLEKSAEPPSFKHCIISSTKLPDSKIKQSEPAPVTKVKDSFDLLVESTKAEESKKAEANDNLFSLSFPSIAPRDKFLSDKSSYSKSHGLSAENLCVKTKPSETFDLSKTIPGIIERLKKDVVNDLKVTDSPPPQKEELSFNFLRGSQDTGKSLSRSESSNSLRICEDMSDTNDSNTDFKETIVEKISSPSVVSQNLASDNAVPCPSENLKGKNMESAKPSNFPTEPVTSNISTLPEKKDENLKHFSKQSVITATSNKSPVVPVINFDAEKDIKIITSSESVSKKIEETEKKIESVPVKSDKETISEEPVSKIKESVAKSENSVLEEKKDSKLEKNIELKSEPTTLTKSEKDSLFDDLLKIKNTSNSNQSSVIMWNTDMKPSLAVEEKNPNSPAEKDVKKEQPSTDKKDSPLSEDSDFSKIEEKIHEKSVDDMDSNPAKNIKSEDENVGEDSSFSMLKKESKKKKLGKKLKKFGLSGMDDSKMKDGKSKSKKRLRLENEDSERSKDHELKLKSKKFKKNKNKKRLAKHDDLLGEHKKGDIDEEHKDTSEKLKRKEKRKIDKKFLKSGIKGDFESRLEFKKKKGKKNRDKLGSEKKDFLEKKTKKKKRLHIEDNQDTDSDKETTHKTMEKKKKKDRKKFKTKDSSSSEDNAEKFYKDQTKILNLPSSSALLRQDSKSDDPDMSFLLCEEKVPASPGDIGNNSEDTSGSSSMDNNRMSSVMDILPIPNVCPINDNLESLDALNKHSIDTSTVLDNTPPTTPSSTESLLSSSPSHERDSFSMNYPESTQSGRDSGEGESDLYRVNANRVISRGSEEYNAAQTLAFAVCKTVAEKPKDEGSSHSFLKRSKSEIEEHSPSKRKKKSKRVRRCSESGKSPRHKSSLSRIPKVESCCEDSSGASPATSSSPPYSSTSTMSLSRSPHRMTCPSEGFSRYNLYVPLHEKDPEKRIALLQDKMAALRKEYMELRAKVIAIDHKRRRARKKMREAGAANPNPPAHSEDGPGCS